MSARICVHRGREITGVRSSTLMPSKMESMSSAPVRCRWSRSCQPPPREQARRGGFASVAAPRYPGRSASGRGTCPAGPSASRKLRHPQRTAQHEAERVQPGRIEALDLVSRHGSDVGGCAQPSERSARRIAQPIPSVLASDATPRCASMASADRQMIGDATLGVPEGREVVLRLLEDADVLIENFKTGTLERWGMGFDEVLSQRFPRLILCRIPGFGDSGPLGGLAGYDAAVQALSGLMSINGEPAGQPTRLGVPIVDVATGLNAAIGILMAVVERTRSGRGQQIESTLYDCALSSLYPHSINTLFTGKPPLRSGNGHPNIAPYDTYATGTDPIFLALGNNGQFE